MSNAYKVTISLLSLYRLRPTWDWGGGHVGVKVTPLGSGVTADDIRLGLRNRPEVGVTVSSSRQGRCRVTDRVRGHRQGALRLPRRLCALNRKPDVPPNTGPLFCSVITSHLLLASKTHNGWSTNRWPPSSRVVPSNSCYQDRETLTWISLAATCTYKRRLPKATGRISTPTTRWLM